MSVHEHSSSDTDIMQSTTTSWLSALDAETATIDKAGVHAALLSIRLHEKHSDRTLRQMHNLLGHLLSPTDRFEQTSDDSFTVLLAPQEDLFETVTEVREIAEALERTGLHASTGFAQRRAGEPLVDTWARAEAQLDRAAYRLEHQNGLSL